MARYHFEDFCWFPAASVEKAVEYMEQKFDAIHLNSRIYSIEELQTLLDAAKKYHCVEALFIPCNELGNEGCRVISEFLKEDHTLSFLYLERNQIGDEGVRILCEGLEGHKRMHALFLGDNNIGDEGVKYLVDHLRSDKSPIKEFSVGNQFGDPGALLIAKAMNHNKDIEGIYLNNNNMTQLGSKVLAEVVARHNTCQNVQVSSLTINEAEFDAELKKMTENELKIAFETAVKNDEKGPWMRSKIMVVGQGRAGKSATVRSLLGQKYVENLDSTVGASISQSNTKAGAQGSAWKDTKGAKVDFTVDTAARLAALKLARKRNQDAENLENFSIEETINYYQERQQADLEERELINRLKREKATGFDDQAEEINKRFEAELVTNKHSGQDDIAFTIWDYGGQTVFYTLHHLFLTRYGIYLLVFDMREVVCDKKPALEKASIRAQTRDYLLFWLNSVNMHAPDAPLMIIGTFLDMVETPEKIRFVNEFLDKIISDRHRRQIQTNGDALLFFPLNNRRPESDVTELMSILGARVGRNIEVIRDKIETVAQNEDFVRQELSLRWVKTLDTLLEQDDSFLALDKVYEVASKCGMKDSNEVDKMLGFFHELGMIVHLTTTHNLRQVVTTKPQWLIDALSQVIRDQKLHKFNSGEVKKAGLEESYALILTKAIATSDWLEYVWQKKQVEFLVDLMRRTLLLSEWRFGDFAKDPAFLVPSLLSDFSEEDENMAEICLNQFDNFEQESLLTPEEMRQAQQERLGDLAGTQTRRIAGFGRLNFARMIPAGLGGKEKEDEDKITPEDMKIYLGDFPPCPEGEDPEKHERKMIKRYKPKTRKHYGFLAKKPIRSIVFDFSESFLPSGVFQRLLCLCILKCMNRGIGEDPLPEPILRINSAVIHMGQDQVFKLVKRDLQILCQVKNDHFRSYQMLSSMMEKLKADVMGHGLDWTCWLEVEYPDDSKRNRIRKEKLINHSMRTFMPVEQVKNFRMPPWFTPDEEEDGPEAPKAAELAGIELEAFLQDLGGF